MTQDMTAAIETLFEVIKADYARFMRNGDTAVSQNMICQFNNSLSVSEGNKYIKVIKGGSVWGFIVNTDKDKKFRRGDILKAASWATPARNQARGNILDGAYDVSWTGPRYL